MKISAFALAAVAGATIGASANAAVLTSWDFENLLSTYSVTGANSGNIASTGGLFAGNASGTHASAATAYSSPVGNGSARSFSSNTWAIGDYYQFTSSTLGYQNITISWTQTSSNTGPRDFGLFWSTNGTTFTQIGSTLTVLANASPNPTWSSGTAQAIFNFGPTAGPANLDNQATVYFRLVNLSNISANGGSVGTGGTDRVDDVVISGDAIPAPGSIALVGLAGLFAGRRRRI
ncbi:MAG: PEP-CTERM sorting domain-containing protein [Phycisphaeraceae bacterium]|nr:PEP-CTERM sorting domain-containing protein [Phycisphaeraceae bacterium]